MSALRIAVGRAQYLAYTSVGRRLLRLRHSAVRARDLTIPVLVRDGRGDPLVFIHGFGADKEGWIGLIARVGRRPVVALDLPGFGAATRIPGARSNAGDQARAVKDALDALGTKRATLVGASMGGAVTLRFAADFPEATRAIVLLGSVGPVVDKSPFVLGLDEGKNPLIPSSHDEFFAMLDFVTVRRPWLPSSIGAFLAAEQVKRKPELVELFDGWVAQDGGALDAALERVKAPTLVIHGERDRVIDVSSARAIAERIPTSKLLVLPDVGHVPQLEVPQRVARAITDFAPS